MLKIQEQNRCVFFELKKVIHQPHNALLLCVVFLILSDAGPERGGWLEGMRPLSSPLSLHTFRDRNISVQAYVHRELRRKWHLWGWAPRKGQQYVIVSERLLNCVDPKRWLGLGAGYRRRFGSKAQVEASTAVAPSAQSNSVSRGCLRVQVANGHLQMDELSGN